MATSAVDGGGNISVGGEDIKFSVMISLFQWIQKSKSSAKKRSKFRKFIDTFCRKPQDNFAAMRLILPGLDRERGSYGLKEHVLATCLIDALAMSRDSDDARRLLNWRRGGPKTGSNAGNFSLVAAEVLQRRQGMASAGLTIKELNDFLDHLASSGNRAEKTSVLSDLIRKTNAQEMKWIIMIILKDLKLGISEKSIFHEFHPDAEDLFNVTCDIRLVCEKLRDRSQRHKRQFSFSEAEKHVLYNTKLHVVGARWLEDSFKEDQKLLEESYSLKPSNFQVSISEKRHDKLKGNSEKCKRSSSPDKHGVQIKAEGISDQSRAITLRKRDRKRDRGRPTGSATAKGKVGINTPRRVKRKVTTSRAKIHENESDEGATSGEHLHNDENEATVGTCESHETIAAHSSGIQNEDAVQDLELSPDGETLSTRDC